MAKDFYRILGVKHDATEEEIRSAYRERVKKLHPDRFGRNSEPFLLLQKAYETLRDPKLRRAYDKKKYPKKGSPPKQKHVNPKRRRSPVEPLTNLDQSNFSDWVSRKPLSHPRGDSFSNTLLDRFFGNISFPTHDTQILEVELPITSEQARRGGRFQVQIPVELPCPNCMGRGHINLYACSQCRGLGRHVFNVPLDLDLPAGIDHHSRGRISLRQYGLPGVELVIHFVIR